MSKHAWYHSLTTQCTSCECSQRVGGAEYGMSLSQL